MHIYINYQSKYDHIPTEIFHKMCNSNPLKAFKVLWTKSYVTKDAPWDGQSTHPKWGFENPEKTGPEVGAGALRFLDVQR